uniref:Uncharacterized protein n=1 Tax=Micrurus carvalhoi TaxID=3147026 RepID=A0A2H6N316_9SAUR
MPPHKPGALRPQRYTLLKLNNRKGEIKERGKEKWKGEGREREINNRKKGSKSKSTQDGIYSADHNNSFDVANMEPSIIISRMGGDWTCILISRLGHKILYKMAINPAISKYIPLF